MGSAGGSDIRISLQHKRTWVQSLDWEDPLEWGMATHKYSCLENTMDRGAWWATVSMGSQRVRHD